MAESRPVPDPPPAPDRLADHRRIHEESRRPGSPRAARRQRVLGRHTARERIGMLVDEGSFTETGPLVRRRTATFGPGDRPWGDGVVTGYGTVDGRTVCVYAQDVTSLGGTVGERFGQKVGALLDLALEIGAPVVGISDSSGARVQEGALAVSAYARVARRVGNASGVVPQISVIMGMCAGGAVYTPAATDFVVMVDRTSYMFVTGPAVIRSASGEAIGLEELGGGRVHATRTGNAHHLAADEPAAMEFVRELLGLLPGNNLDEAPYVAPQPARAGKPDDVDAELDDLVPGVASQGYDMRDVIERIVDGGECLEIHEEFAPNVLCGFARIDGRTVGVVANQPSYLAGSLDIDASEKAARFVRFCDAFAVPILTLVDVPGFLPGSAQEHAGIIRRGAKLGFAYIESTVPKVTVIVRKAYGGGYAVMGSKELGADLCFAWPMARIGVMGARSGVDLVFRAELAAAEDPELLRPELEQRYDDALTSPYTAAEIGCIDDVIAPHETRATVRRAFAALRGKRVTGPPRKHSNIPL